MADQTRIKIEECLKTCLANLSVCQNNKEFAVPLQIMTKQVFALIRPDCDVVFAPFMKDPQENQNQEDGKDETAYDVNFWMKKLTVGIKERAEERLNQIKEMLDNRAAMTQSLNIMKKQNANVHSSWFQKQAIDSFTKDIDQLQNEEIYDSVLEQNISKEFIEKIKKTIEQNQLKKVLPIQTNFEIRLSTPYMQIWREQGTECPPKNAQSLDNYLVAIQNNYDGEFNFCFKLGVESDLNSSEQLKETKIQPEGSQVKRAVVWYNPSTSLLTSIELFDKDGLKILEAGTTQSSRQHFNNKQQEILLEEGEKIIGFKSRKFSDNNAWHKDFQFLLGKLI